MGTSRQRVDPGHVQLVDESGCTRGSAGEAEVHAPPGRLHRAFSVFLVDCMGKVLLQRRSVLSCHSAGFWSHTCSGHPWPGETPIQAACRRLAAELDAEPFGLSEVGAVSYRLPAHGLGRDDWLIEHEWNHVFVGMTLNPPSPDPLMIAEHRFVPIDHVDEVVGSWEFTSLFPMLWQVAFPDLSMLVRRPGSSGTAR